MDEEAQLSAHIRHLLLDYARCHITTDYVQYTQLAVAEASTLDALNHPNSPPCVQLVSLEQVPTYDPASLTLPTDPFKILISLVDLGSLPLYQEKFTTSQDACLLLKSALSLPKGPPRSEHLLWSRGARDSREDDDFYHVEPILTRRAARETPVLGKTGGEYRRKDMQKLNLKAYADLISSTLILLKPVDVQPIHESEVSIDQVLDVKYHLKAADHAAVRELIKAVSIMSRAQPFPANANKSDFRRMYLPASFDFDQPCQDSRPPDSPPLVPIFARTARLKAAKNTRMKKDPGRTMHRPALHSMADIPGCIGASVSDTSALGSDDDRAAGTKSLARENMVIVDGWQTYATSSPSTICSADDDEIDELIGMFPSSPDTDISAVVNLVRDVEDSKLDEVQIPRERRIGGGTSSQGKETIADRARKAGGLGKFLAPLLEASMTPASKDIKVQSLHPLLDSKLASVRRAPPEAQSGGEARKAEDPTRVLQASAQNKAETDMDVDADSIRGQPSVAETTTTFESTVLDKDEKDEKNEENEIRGLYQDLSRPGQTRLGPHLPRTCPDPIALIRDEKLFDDEEELAKGKEGEKNPKEEGLRLHLMTVPLLGAPNTDAKPRVREYTEYLIEPGAGPLAQGASGAAGRNKSANASSMRFLKGVKGMASLRVALSWVPYIRAKSTSAYAGILGNNFLREMEWESGEAMQGEVRALLRKAGVETDCDEEGGLGGCGFHDEHRWRGGGGDVSSLVEGNEEFSPEIAKCEIVLTRAERRALTAREGGGMPDERDVSAGDRDDTSFRATFEDSYPVNGDTRNTTRSREDENTLVEDDEFRPAKRARLSFEDSGIGMMLDPIQAVGDESLLDFDRNGMLEELNTRPENGDANHMLHYRLRGDDDLLIPGSYQKFHPNCDKESNWPVSAVEPSAPELFGDIQPALTVGDDPRCCRDQEQLDYEYDDEPEESFDPLSFSYDSQTYLNLSAQHSQTRETQASQEQDTLDWPRRRILGDITELGDGVSIENTDFDTDMLDADQTTSCNGHLTYVNRTPPKELDLDLPTHSLGIEAFAALRARKITSSVAHLSSSVSNNQAAEANPPVSCELDQQERRDDCIRPRIIPHEVLDRKTLRFPSSWTLPATIHRYMASLDLLQKQVLVRSLSSPDCLVELVERDSLEGVDLIIDPHTAIIFTPLLSLPAHNKKLLATLSAQTWRYKRLLVVFEAYPASRSYKAGSRIQQKQGHVGAEPELYAYTPPIVKAVKKFRRDLDIAEGCGNNAVTCEVWSAFADSVQEAAAYARWFGDEAEKEDCTQGAIWGDREWLDLEVSEDEDTLALLGGMNRFSASIVLCQMDLQQFIDLDPASRITTVSPFIGREAIDMLNMDIERRTQTTETSEFDVLRSKNEMDVDGSTEDSY
ncbi:hypothetical protein D9615_000036 [Tricholomella constricta]|uniref:Uncharacterized protein n=1 Tax=Tricholomella constricta TaxID=117010 RepID=A0A8H5MB82_9AGAR|nr:hypothetical protein D9615_000036 [Tricholomella constricta]